MSPTVVLRSVERSDGRGLFPWETLRSDLEALDDVGGEVVWLGPNPFLSPWFPRAIAIATARGYRSWAQVDASAVVAARRVEAAREAGLVGLILPVEGGDDWGAEAQRLDLARARTWDPSQADGGAKRAASEGAELRWPEGLGVEPAALAAAFAHAAAHGVGLRATHWPAAGRVDLRASVATHRVFQPPAPLGVANAAVAVWGVRDPAWAAALRGVGVRTPDLPRCHGGEATPPTTSNTDPTCRLCTVTAACSGPREGFAARPDPRFRALPPRARIVVVTDPTDRTGAAALAAVAEAFAAMGFSVEQHGVATATAASAELEAPARAQALQKQHWRTLDFGAADLVVTTPATRDVYLQHPTIRPGTRFETVPSHTSRDDHRPPTSSDVHRPWALARRWAFGTRR